MKKTKNKKKLASESKPQDTPEKVDTNYYIVGIGASAGGLEALRSLFGAIKEPEQMSYIVVQHLAPSHRSRLVELIAHATKVKVQEVTDGVVPARGVAYITPPNKDVYFEKGRLKLRPPRMKVGPKPSIDEFLISFAEDQRSRAIAVILSGTGTDGARGIRDIKAEGGIVMCQTSESAKYDGMPKAAKHTGVVDYELSPEEIAVELARLSQQRATGKVPVVKQEGDFYENILRYLEKQNGTDFSLYKKNTIRRRINRRLHATHSENLERYFQYLKVHPGEVKELFQDLLISVTSFFRDASAFQSLRVSLTALIREKRPGEQLRCWCIGCATGEEAYSLAIIIFDICDKMDLNLNVQIFATDLDERVLAFARKGIYSPESVSDIDKNLLEKYFTRVDNNYQVKRSLRESVVFAKHNVCDDPPFLNLDLVTCRNVLIYFNSELQSRVFQSLFYAIRQDGLLFLGKSENAPTLDGKFTVIDKSMKVYGRGDAKAELPRPSRQHEAKREAHLRSKGQGGDSGADIFESMIAGFAPNSIIVDADMKVRHIYGAAGTFLNVAPGEASFAVTKLLPSEWGLEATALIQRAAKQVKAARGRQHIWTKSKQKFSVRMVAVPLYANHVRTFILNFVIEPVEPEKETSVISGSSGPAAKKLRQAERELNELREHLQTVIEEQETSNEELQSLNEELQSANEELQSSNEELETANEELQSSNEELTTLNQEINVKSAEIIALNQTLSAVQNAMIYPIATVNRSMRLMHFNPAARHLFRLNEQDIGSAIKSIPAFADIPTVTTAMNETMETERENSLQLKVKDRSFEVQIQAFHGAKGQIDGVVVSFVDNTEIVTSLQEAKLIKQRLSDILDNTPAMAMMKDTSGVVIYANRRFCRFVHSDPQAILGVSDEELFGVEASAKIRDHDLTVIRTRKAIQVEEKIVLNGVTHYWTSSKFPLLDSKGKVQSVCTIALDITERIQREQELELFRTVVSSATDGIVLFENRESTYTTTFVSKEIEKSIRVQSGDLLNLDIRTFFRRVLVHFDEEKIERLLNNILGNVNYSMTIEVPIFSGSSFIEFRSTRPTKNDNHMVLTFTNVTQQVLDQKTIESQQDEITRYGRYAALGEIAAGIAHEINTPLNVIITKTDFLRKMVDVNRLESEKVKQIANDVDQMTKNISSIVQGLKSLVSKETSEFEKTNLNRLIKDTLGVCSYRIQREGIDLITKLPDDEVYVDCHAVQISQILINLINNSIDAVSAFGEKWIRVELLDRGSQVEIIVTDSGKNIDPSLAEKIMTPFFTTKKDKKGTGIGLSLSRTIAQRHSGNLTLDLQNRNTSFRVELPKERQ